jgi:hypothetical protein
MTVGYVGTKDTKGDFWVCFACVDENRGKDWGAHSFAPVYGTDTYITRNGGKACDSCGETFI